MRLRGLFLLVAAVGCSEPETEAAAPTDSGTVVDSTVDSTTERDVAEDIDTLVIDSDLPEVEVSSTDSAADSSVDSEPTPDSALTDDGTIDTGSAVDTAVPDTATPDISVPDTFIAESTPTDGACTGDTTAYPAASGCPTHDWACWPTLPDSPGAANYTIVTSCGDGVVIDKTTKLMWAREEEPLSYTWADAELRCKSSRRGGFADWRIPTLIELDSLVDHVVTTSPAINLVAFPSATGFAFWTATKRGGGGTAYFVSMDVGYSRDDYVVNKNHLRCVR